MKGGLNGLKGKEISLISIVLMSATILLWTWEKTPGLTAFLPPQTQLQLSSEVGGGGGGSTNKQEELQLNGVTQTVSAESSSRRSIDESHTITTTLTEQIHSKSSDDKAEVKEVLEAGNSHIAQTLSNPEKINENRHQEEGKEASKEAESRTDVVASNQSPQISYSVDRKDNENWNNVTEHKACNFAKGKWVLDNNRPLYSGFECKQWLSAMWACRLTQRTDFAYENIRWQPKDCQMEEFEGSKFLRRMQNKTLAFVGDSLGRQQFQSLMCMITGGKETTDVEDVGNDYGLLLTEGAARPNGWAYRFPSTNTTILYYWSATLCDIEPIDSNNPNTEYAMHLDRPPAFLRHFIHKFDVLVLNTGHHWNRGKLKGNRWVMHVGGVPNTDKKIAVIWGAKNLTIHSVVSWVNSQLPNHPGLKVFFRTISPRHFLGGEWNTGGSCNNTAPMSIGKEIIDEESTDKNAAHAVKGTGVKLLDITAISQLRDEGHISRFSITAKPGVQDCLHWCLPGVPDTWNEILFAQI
ncbi:protein trichome birefringence-like 16 isoform X1 [Prosopis cineraria]|uniref:protein trichome birefringence-like 16 isoform X1 n=1 Tax=Prosopis cineraria TaxID=364024 RepID=UPI00240FA3B1|nr:protein trichome birefringence-like 16 isoform X1 [Prosopis cineraria]